MHLVDGHIEFSLHLPVNIHYYFFYWHNSKENLGRRASKVPYGQSTCMQL